MDQPQLPLSLLRCFESIYTSKKTIMSEYAKPLFHNLNTTSFFFCFVYDFALTPHMAEFKKAELIQKKKKIHVNCDNFIYFKIVKITDKGQEILSLSDC
jgi:hypothetical protein